MTTFERRKSRLHPKDVQRSHRGRARLTDAVEDSGITVGIILAVTWGDLPVGRVGADRFGYHLLSSTGGLPERP